MIELVSIGAVPSFHTRIRYSTIAPGIALGLMLLTGSEIIFELFSMRKPTVAGETVALLLAETGSAELAVMVAVFS
jgi:hypothetical protein